MASTAKPPMTCTVCAKSATTHCGGCANEEITKDPGYRTQTLYCGTACQQSDWQSHKKFCNIVKAQTKLFRAADILQAVFLATREEAFDLSLAKVQCWNDGTFHIHDSPDKDQWSEVRPLPVALADDSEVKRAVLSWVSGIDVLFGVMLKLGKEVFAGYSAKIEEAYVRVSETKVKVRRHLPNSEQAEELLGDRHVVLCVTLKDGSTWAVDPAGAQHGQHKPVLRFSDYNRDYLVSLAARHPYGKTERSTRSVPGCGSMLALVDNWAYQSDELYEWIHKNVNVKELLKIKPPEYERLKKSLVAHLATAAREYVKLAMGDPTSKAKVIIHSPFGGETLSDEDKERAERKRARALANMDSATRQLVEQAEASGNKHVLFT